MADEKPEKVILPDKYYHTYFCDLLRFVQKYSGHLLDAPDHSFLVTFGTLSEAAQCTFIRMCNRKGIYFRPSKFAYSEIDDIPAAFKALKAFQFIKEDLDEDPAIISLFTKAELIKAFPDLELKALKKDEIYNILLEEPYAKKLQDFDPIVQLERQDQVEFLKMLYFGSYGKPMTEFVVRDVGHVQLEDLDETKFTAAFESREEALAVFEISQLSRAVYVGLEMIGGIGVHEALLEIDWERLCKHDRAQRVANRIFENLGMQLEREKLPEEAMFYYERSTKHPARERLIRLMDHQGETEKAVKLAEHIQEDYWNASERLFAKDFLNRPNIRINRSTSRKLSEATSIEFEHDPVQHVEDQSLAYFARQGFEGVHGENYIWRNLFGLMLWEELFNQDLGKFHNPLQRRSADLYDNTFFKNHKDHLDQKRASLSTSQKWLKQVNKTFTEKYGKANSFVYWYDEMMVPVEKLISSIKVSALWDILFEIAKNPKDNSAGFPDLLIWNEKEYRLCEIKSPNDHLSAQQLFWLDFMQERGINAEIVRVKYIF
ncbi:MAG: VRR-NUC domain-containing protein [Cyclobacteriaceae bacterium]